MNQPGASVEHVTTRRPCNRPVYKK